MASPSPSPGAGGDNDDDDTLFHIDAGRQSPERFILDTKGDELFTSATDLPPPPNLAFLNHDDEVPSEAEEPQGLVLPENARVTKDVEGEAPLEDDGDRYYDSGEGEDEKPVLKCAGCGEDGHLMRKCPHKRCVTCGAIDEHFTRECPMGIVCHKCGLAGHRIRDCTYRGPRRNLCTHCQSAYHTGTACPTLWRIYAYLDDEEYDEEREVLYAEEEGIEGEDRAQPPPEWDPSTRWCYNCAAKGNHWGDDCPEPRRIQLGDYTIWSEVGSRTGPFASSLPPPPKLAQSIYQDEAYTGMRDVDSIMNEYFARKRPRSGPVSRGEDTTSSLLDRMGPGKKERVPHTVQRDRERIDKNRSRWGRDRPTGDLARRMDLDRPPSGGRNSVATTSGGLDYGADEADDWFERRTEQQKEGKKHLKSDAKNRPTGTKKHQPPPPPPTTRQYGKNPPPPQNSNRDPSDAPQFGKNERFAFTFGQGNTSTSTSTSGTSTPLSEGGGNLSSREERRKERKRLKRQAKAAEAHRQKEATGPKAIPKGRKAEAKAARGETKKSKPSSVPTKPSLPTSSTGSKKRSRAPTAAHAPQYHGSLVD